MQMSLSAPMNKHQLWYKYSYSESISVIKELAAHLEIGVCSNSICHGMQWQDEMTFVLKIGSFWKNTWKKGMKK